MKIFLFVLTLFSVATVRSLIHMIGDSHIFFCFTDPKGEGLVESNKKIIKRKDFSGVSFKLNWVGPRLLYRVQDVIESLIEEKQFSRDLSERDILIFSFGEIDCRLHIAKQAQLQNVSTECIIDDLVTRYEAALQMVYNKFSSLHLRMVILSIIPPYKQYVSGLRIGTLEQHIEIVFMLNKKLEEMAIRNKFNFLDVFNLYAQEDGTININEIDNWTHVSKISNFKIWDLLLHKIYSNGLRSFLLKL